MNVNKNKKDFPGLLILVVGNSGSGKDSIMKGVKERFPPELKSLYLAQRFITRPSSDTEDNVAVTPKSMPLPMSPPAIAALVAPVIPKPI